MKNRRLSFVVALWFALSSTMYSVNSYAIPLVVGIATRLLSPVMATAIQSGTKTVMAIGALAVGAVISNIIFPTDKGTVNILPGQSAASQMAGTTGNGVAPVGSITMGYGCNCGNQIVTITGDLATACAGSAAKANTCGCTPGGYKVDSVNTSTNSCHISMSNGTGGYYPPWVKTCPSGMSLMGDGLCYTSATSGSQAGQLPQTEGYVTPKSVVLPGASSGTQTDNGDGFKNLPGAAPSPSIGSRFIPLDGTQANSPATVSVEPLVDGGVKVTTKAYDPTTGQTTGTTKIISPSGVVLSSETTIQQGNTTTTPTTTTTTGNTGAPLEIPNDYNRESTQQSMNTKIGEIKADATTDRDQASSRADAIQSDVTQAISSTSQDASRWTRDGLGLPTKDDFQAPSTGSINSALPEDSGCTPIPLSFLGHSLALDVCPVIDVMKPIINWSVMFSAVIATWQFILGRRESA